MSGKTRSFERDPLPTSKHPVTADGRAKSGRSKHLCAKNRPRTVATSRKPCPVKNKDKR